MQESVCATYGAGVSSACVVDVGDQKVSVCCVEDGNSTVNTRFDNSQKVKIDMLNCEGIVNYGCSFIIPSPTKLRRGYGNARVRPSV